MRALIASVQVESIGDDALEVCWDVTDGQPVPVEVAVGPTPVATDHDHVVTVEAGVTTVRLDDLGPGRHYVSVAPRDGGGAVIAGERRLPFAGITNFRDIGGYPTANGGHVRWGQVFRADVLHKLTPADIEGVGRLGVRTVYDLRGDVERTEFPGPFDSVHLSIVGRPADAVPVAPNPDMTATDGELMLRDMYVGALTHSAAKFGELLTGLADPDRLPAVFHCHGGKDRTGIVAVLLLLSLGVDRETALDDYEATRRYRTITEQQDTLAKFLAAGVAPEAAAGVLGTPRWAMAAAVDALETDHGGIDTYLTGIAGMSDAAVRRLRALHIVGGD